MGIGGVGIVLVLAAMAGPWWSISYNAGGLGLISSGNRDFGLFGGTARDLTEVGSQTRSISYEPQVWSVFSTATELALVGLGAGVAMIAANATGEPQKGRIGGVLGLVAFLLTLLAAVYVMTSLPAAVNLDSGQTWIPGFAPGGFWGSQMATSGGFSATVTWGAGWGWYAVPIAATLFLMGAFASLRGQRAPAGRAPGYPP
jgi:hypothetical protein